MSLTAPSVVEGASGAVSASSLQLSTTGNATLNGSNAVGTVGGAVQGQLSLTSRSALTLSGLSTGPAGGGAAVLTAPALSFGYARTEFDSGLTVQTNGAVTGSAAVKVRGDLTFGGSGTTPSSVTLPLAEPDFVTGSVTGAVVLGPGVSGLGPLRAGSIDASSDLGIIQLYGNLTATSGDIVLDATSSPIVASSADTLTAAAGTVRLYSSTRNGSYGLNDPTIQGSTYDGDNPEFANSATERWNETSANTDVPAVGSYRIYYADQGKPTVALGVSPTSPGTYPAAEKVTATVTAGGGGTGDKPVTPAGAVAFFVTAGSGTKQPASCTNASGSNSVTLGAGSGSSATAECDLAGLTASSSAYTLGATYTADGTTGSEATGTTAYATTPASTTYSKQAATPGFTLTRQPASGTIAHDHSGYPGFRVTAALTGVQGGATPTGTVEFDSTTGSQSSTLCAAAPVQSGSATCTATLPPGVNAITATYSGDANYTAVGPTSAGTVEVVAPPKVTTTSLPDAAVGASYRQQLAVDPGYPTDSTLTVGSLPPGLTASSDGTISGTPTAAGSYTVTVLAAASDNGTTVTQASQVSLYVWPETTGTTLSVAPGTVGVGGTATLSAVVKPSGGTVAPGGTVDFTVGSTTLSGTLNAKGIAAVTYTATAADIGTHTVTAAYQGTDDFVASKDTGSLEVDSAPTILTTSLPDAVVGATYSAPVSVADGYPSGSTLTATGLPPGLSLSGTTISGTPTLGGTATVVLTASNDSSLNLSSTRSIALHVAPASTTTTLQLTHSPARTGDTVTATATVYPTPVDPQSTPSHVTFSEGDQQLGAAKVALSGDDAGTASITLPTDLAEGDHAITATYSGDASYASSTDRATLELDQAPQVVTTQTLDDGTVGQAYDQTVEVDAGYPTTATVTADGLPSGLSMNEAGTDVVGTPTAAGDFTPTFTAYTTASDGTVVAGTPVHLALHVAAAPTVTTLTLSPTTAGPTDTVTATAAVSPVPDGGSVRFDVDGAPQGQAVPVTLTGDGAGTATVDLDTTGLTGGPHTVEAVYDGSSNDSGSHDTATLTVNSAPVITTASLADGTVGTPYRQPVDVQDGFPATTTTSVTGLPDGLRYDAATSVIEGTPAHAGSATVTIRSDNGSVAPAERTLSLHVDPVDTVTALTLSSASLDRGDHLRATATVSPSPDGGSVQFRVDGQDVGSPVDLSGTSGTVSTSVDTSGLATGAHTVEALFSGTADENASTATQAVAVADAPTSTTVSTSRTSLTAAVTSAVGPPPGQVTFLVDGAVVGSAALTDGQASVPMTATIVRALTGGLHVIRARYDGSTGFAGSSGLTGVMSPVVSATPTSARPAT
ncbi:Ig-like domain repeat protein, partial [Jatrophihabitans endophyticus]|uniref:beta strand repeat-containing protein n=1 Tax=Jatrophihabitans endophyticus TaxID=1206085 RepID=UPI0026EA4C5C